MTTISVRKGKVSIKTNLSALAIISYTERICDIRGWQYNIPNLVRAKVLLDAMSIIEQQTGAFLPVDFEYIFDKMEQQIRFN